MAAALLVILRQMIQVYQELLRLSEQKREVLIQRDIDNLLKIVQEEEILIKQISRLENDRVAELSRILDSQESSTANSHWSHVLQLVDSKEEKEQLQQSVNQLDTLMEEVHSTNQVNSRLIKEALQFVHSMLEQVTQSAEMNYTNPLQKGRNRAGEGQGFFDSKA